MGKLCLAGAREQRLVHGLIIALALGLLAGCRPSEGSNALDSNNSYTPVTPTPDSQNSFLSLKNATLEAIKAGTCMGNFVLFPANPQAIPIAVDPKTGKTTQVPYLEGDRYFYLPKESLTSAASPDLATVVICFDTKQQVAKVSTSDIPASSEQITLSRLRICGVVEEKQTRSLPETTDVIGEQRICELLLPLKP